MTEAYKQAEKLRELYHEKGMSQRQIGDKLGCSNKTVHYWMKKHGIERRKAYDESDHPAHFGTNMKGYESWGTKIDGETCRVFVHRLVAVAEYGFDVVCGNEVHHKNSIPFDNRPSNLEVMSRSEHARRHADIRSNSDPVWRNEEKLRELYREKGMSQRQIGDKLGCSQRTVLYWMKKYGIETRSRGGQPINDDSPDDQEGVDA